MRSIRRWRDKFRNLSQDVRHFWRTELWQLDPSTLPARSAFFLRVARTLDLVARGIRKNDLRVNAAGLTYMTLLALIPFVAIVIWIFKALGFHVQFLEETTSYFSEFPPHFRQFLDQTLSLVEQTNFAQLGIVGAAVLVLTAFSLLGKMETSFDKIWGIAKQRSLLRRWTNYLGVIILIPVLIFVAITLAAPINPFANVQGKVGSFLAVWLGFGFIYAKLPHTKVNLLASSSAGLAATCLFLAWLWVFSVVQPGVTRYNLIYGTLSFLPIFLAWLYMSWVIVLLGAEIACAIQNEKSFPLHREGGRISLATQMAVALAIMVRAARAFIGKAQPLEINNFSHEHQIPYRFLQSTMDRLSEGGLLIRSEDPTERYVLAKSPELIDMNHIVDLFLNRGRQLLDLELQDYQEVLWPITQTFGPQLDANLGEISLQELVQNKWSPETSQQTPAPGDGAADKQR